MTNKTKAILRPIADDSEELIRNIASSVNRPIVLCSEYSLKQYEGVNVEFDDIRKFLDGLNHLSTQVEFLYSDLNSRGKLVNMLMNRKIGYIDEE